MIIEEILELRAKDNYITYKEYIGETMSKRKQLYDIENYLDLDKELENLHQVKLAVDLLLDILERTYVEKVQEKKSLEEELKYQKLLKQVAFENSLKKQETFLTQKELEIRKNKKLIELLKDEEGKVIEVSNVIDFLRLDIKHYERIRENIGDIYMSLKKKYDLVIRKLNI